MRKCHKCGTPVTAESVSRRDECPVCGSDLHVCLSCVFYDEAKANRCREPQADPVQEKDRSNFCDYFQFNAGKNEKQDKERAEQLWKALFKKQ
jgi:hypothetical protein